MAKDPICGMEVEGKKAKFSTVKNGKKYFFCSKSCHDKFNGNGNKKTALRKNSLKKTKSIAEKIPCNIQKTAIAIFGMHCASCANTIEKALSKTDGVIKANVNFASEKANVEFDKNKIDEGNLKNVVRKTGYKVR